LVEKEEVEVEVEVEEEEEDHHKFLQHCTVYAVEDTIQNKYIFFRLRYTRMRLQSN
jgi:hypothetical protein